MKKPAFLCFLAVVAVPAAALDLSLAMNGDVRLGKTGARIGMVIHCAGWSATVGGVRRDFRSPDPESRTASFEFVDRDVKYADGRVTLVETADRKALLSAALTSARDQKPETVCLALSMKAETFAGARWRDSNGTTGTLPATFDGKTLHAGSGAATWIEFAPPKGEAFRLTFPVKTSFLIQDDRKWVHSFTLRILSGGRRALDAGEQRAFECLISADGGVTTTVEQPVVVKAGPDWIPLDYRKDILAGSALDFSGQGWLDAPAGKHGWLRNVNGHFEFEGRPGKPQRFYGVNLCFGASFPEHELADRLVTRLVRLGYNSVRIHHYESADGVIKGSADRLTLNAEQMDRLDYLLAKFIAAGVYITTDLFTCRPVLWRDIGIARDGQVPMQLYKVLVCTYEPATRNWETFAERFLTHRNPYTGRTYAEESALPLISLVNEGSFMWCWQAAKVEEPVKAAWRAWLAEGRAKDPKFMDGVSEDPAENAGWTDANRPGLTFTAAYERRFVARARAFMKRLGARALLTNQNCGSYVRPLHQIREEVYDYVDDHFYVDHPSFLLQPWSLPSKCPNENPVFNPDVPPFGKTYTRLATKPYCITEWNFSGPGMYRGVGGIMTGAQSAVKDWDGLWRFAYSHSRENLLDGRSTPGYFDTGTDPLGQAGDRASICLFLRGDMPVGGDGQGALAFDRARGTFLIRTAKTAGGFTPGGALDAGAVRFTASDTPTTVWASALDGERLETADRVLVTHLTDVQGDGTVYADPDKRILLTWGRGAVVRAGTAEISLALAEPSAYTVWALDTTGARVEQMPARAEGGRLVFTADVKGPHGARMSYEVIRK